MKSKKVKIITVIILILLLLSSSIGIIYAMPNEKAENINDTSLNNITDDVSANSQNEKSIKITLASEIVSQEDNFSAEFSFDENVVNYHYISDGISVINQNSKSKNLNLTLNSEEEFGKLDLYIEYNNGEHQKKTIYTYTTAGMTFISDSAEDDAWFKAIRYKYESGLISAEEMEDEYGILSRRRIENLIVESNELKIDQYLEQSSSDANTYVNGQLGWFLENGTWMPLKGMKIELRDKEPIGSNLLATTYTEIDGTYSFSFINNTSFSENGYDIFISVFPASKTFDIRRPNTHIITGELYYSYYNVDTVPIKDVNTGSTNTLSFDFSYDENNNFNKSYYIAQSMVVGQRFALQYGMNSDAHVFVTFPFTLSLHGIDLYTIEQSMCLGEEILISPDGDWKSWDVPIHEYGHFVEHTMGTYGINIGAMILMHGIGAIDAFSHYSDTDHLNDKAQYGKEFAMELTYSEAWATAFAQIAQQCYSGEYNLVPYADDRTDGTDYRYFNPSDESGEGQEDAVIVFLLELFDEFSIDFGPNQGYQKWWSATTQTGTYTLTDLVKILYYQYPNYKSAIGKILGDIQVSPSNFKITNSYSMLIPPSFSWKINGSTHNPNDKFVIDFYDIYGNYKSSINGWIKTSSAYNTNYTYTMSQSNWNYVLSHFSGNATIIAYVQGYNENNSPTSGPYISNSIIIQINITNYENLNIPSNSRYTERNIFIESKNYKEYILSFSTGGLKTIQTFGIRGTCLELYDISGKNLIYSSSTNGATDAEYYSNALFSYNFESNKQYILRISFFNFFMQYGNIKLAITSNASVSNYDNIYHLQNFTSGIGGWLLYPNQVWLATYTFTETKAVTFQTESASNTDLYLYIIDPRSTELVYQYNSLRKNYPSLYDDDGAGNLNAKITKIMEAGVKYLVIVSAYNPASTSNPNPVHFNLWTSYETHSISFNSNGGSSVPSINNVPCGSIITAPAPPTRTGYTFGGWYNNAACTGTAFDFNSNAISEDKTLYAKWTPISYTIKYNANGGTGTMSNSSFTYGVSGNLKTNTFTRTGYTFAGWSTSSSGSVAYTNGQSVTNLTSVNGTEVNLYAKWLLNYTITFNGNGGTPTTTTQSIANGSTITPPTNPTRSGYAFAGWYTNSSCTGSAVNFNNYTVNGAVTFYARWIVKATANVGYSGTISNGNTNWYSFTAPASGKYSFSTTSSINTYGEIFSSVVEDGSTTGRLAYDDNGGDGNNFRLEYTLSAGQTIYIRVKGNNSSTSGNYTFYVNNVVDIIQVTLSTGYAGTINNGNCYWFSYTATAAGVYRFYSYGATDAYGELFTNVVADGSNVGRLDYNDNNSESSNFIIYYHLTAGQTVYVRVRGANSSVYGNFTFYVDKLNGQIAEHYMNYTGSLNSGVSYWYAFTAWNAAPYIFLTGGNVSIQVFTNVDGNEGLLIPNSNGWYNLSADQTVYIKIQAKAKTTYDFSAHIVYVYGAASNGLYTFNNADIIGEVFIMDEYSIMRSLGYTDSGSFELSKGQTVYIVPRRNTDNSSKTVNPNQTITFDVQVNSIS